MSPGGLPASDLRRGCDPDTFSFGTTEELTGRGLLGHERAIEALRFALEMRRDGYNAFALGPAGLGKHAMVRDLLEARAAERPAPRDWCYVHNFADPWRPKALALPAGRAPAFRADMGRLIGELGAAIPSAFDSDDYRRRRKALEERFRQQNEAAFGEIEKHAAERGISVLRTPVGVAFAPSRDGEVVDAAEFEKLPEEERERRLAEVKQLQDELRAILAALPARQREHREHLQRLDREITGFAARSSFSELRTRYADVPDVLAYLDEVARDVVESVELFRPADDDSGGSPQPAGLTDAGRRRYEVNVIVDHAGARGAPVVYEDHPTYPALVGRIEYRAEMGALVTDFRLIKAGALHRANGGYLLLDALKLLQQPFAWEQLKRNLRGRHVRIETLAQLSGLGHTASLDPEPIPLDVKVVLVGERLHYYLLAAHDPDFPDLFKVAADFDERIARDADSERVFAERLAIVAKRQGLLPIDRSGVARVVEESSRRAGDAGQLWLHVEELTDLLREADHLARSGGRAAVAQADVDAAVNAQIHRADRARERFLEDVGHGTLLVDTSGAQVGQVNGLSVVQLGDFAFGRPNRITASVRLGTGRVVDIEREVALGGPLHSKGVLILSGYLGARYASDKPLSLAASLVFEQSYGGVDGDSASLAELLALLSALSRAPLSQALAVTGSVNQLGQVQPIGGVNHKIEGFFDVCRETGLTGEQGVVIPAANRRHLMLRPDVVAAVADGRFRVHAVTSVDEALTLFTGLPAGERDPEGRFPEGSVNARVDARLEELADKARRFAQRSTGEGASNNQK